jgi:hypothetical protein
MDGEEQAIQQFLGDRPNSAQLREWRETLEARLKTLRAHLAAAPESERKELADRIAQLTKQIAALLQEELVTGYVEDSVRVTLAMGRATEGSEEDW